MRTINLLQRGVNPGFFVNSKSGAKPVSGNSWDEAHNLGGLVNGGREAVVHLPLTGRPGYAFPDLSGQPVGEEDLQLRMDQAPILAAACPLFCDVHRGKV